MLNVACVKWGTAYGPEYVNKLAEMIRRHLRVPFKFTCFTDDPEGIWDEDIPYTANWIYVRPLPGNLIGWWNKLWLFSPDLFPTGERVLYLDLDTVICAPIDDIARCEHDFAILRDFTRPRGMGSGVMLWKAGAMNAIWDGFVADEKPDLPGGDQSYIEIAAHRIWGHKLPDNLFLQNLFPGAFVSYKVHCRDGLPPGGRVVCFHGQPKPHNCGAEWIEKHWCIDSPTARETTAA